MYFRTFYEQVVCSRVEPGAKPTYSIFGFLKLGRYLSSIPATEFRGLYSRINVELDEPTTELWNEIERQNKLKKPIDIIKEWKNVYNNVLTGEQICNLMFKLCYRFRFKQALLLTKWLEQDGNEPKSECYKLLKLDILCKTASVEHVAHPYFSNEITNKSETAYLMILRGCTINSYFNRSMNLFEEMKQAKVMTDGRAYMLMLKMFIREGDAKKAIQVLEDFEASGLPPDTEMYWDLLEHRDTLFKSIPVMQKAEEALSKVPMDRLNKRDALKINAVLGKTEEVDRVWNEIKGSPNGAEAVAAIYSYDLLGDLEKVEEISRKLEATKKGFIDHYVVMLRIYARRGNIDKAFEWKDKMGLAGNPGDFEQAHPLILAYLQKGDVDKAVEVYNTYTEKGKDLQHPRSLVEECVVKLNEEFAKRKDVERAEEVMSKIPRLRTVRMFESLIRVYLSADVAPRENIRKRMQNESLRTRGFQTMVLLQRLCGVQGYEGQYLTKDNKWVNTWKETRGLKTKMRAMKKRGVFKRKNDEVNKGDKIKEPQDGEIRDGAEDEPQDFQYGEIRGGKSEVEDAALKPQHFQYGEIKGGKSEVKLHFQDGEILGGKSKSRHFQDREILGGKSKARHFQDGESKGGKSKARHFQDGEIEGGKSKANVAESEHQHFHDGEIKGGKSNAEDTEFEPQFQNCSYWSSCPESKFRIKSRFKARGGAYFVARVPKVRKELIALTKKKD